MHFRACEAVLHTGLDWWEDPPFNLWVCPCCSERKELLAGVPELAPGPQALASGEDNFLLQSVFSSPLTSSGPRGFSDRFLSRGYFRDPKTSREEELGL